MQERIELRCAGGPLLGVLVVRGVTLEVKRGRRLFEVDLRRTLEEGVPVVVERVAHPATKDRGCPVAHPID
jgi:hypothetical protein